MLSVDREKTLFGATSKSGDFPADRPLIARRNFGPDGNDGDIKSLPIGIAGRGVIVILETFTYNAFVRRRVGGKGRVDSGRLAAESFDQLRGQLVAAFQFEGLVQVA